jgi:hypothetical protein
MSYKTHLVKAREEMLAERAELDRVIQQITAMIDSPLGASGVEQPAHKLIAPTDSGRKLSVRDVARQLAAGGTFSLTELTDHLKAAGNNADMSTSTSILSRMIKNGELVRLGKGSYGPPLTLEAPTVVGASHEPRLGEPLAS